MATFWPPDRETTPGVAASLAVGLLCAGLLVGYEPVGGDPDRIFRPIKAELSRALREGRLPFWSDRLGLGVPLVAESHVGAFYPLNWGLYGLLDVASAYRVSMWIHCVAIAAATFAYARQLGLTAWGGAMAAVAFPFCGFLTVHSSHEWAYQTAPYLPLCLLAADRYAASGRARWTAALALLWAVQITLGHFQIQLWTGGLALLTGSWRVVANRRPPARIAGLVFALAWGGVIAAVQLVPTWELAQLVGQTRRSFAELAYYSYPPGHWSEVAVPALFRGLKGGPEDAYWFSQETTGYEASLFIGTIPLILAGVGLVGGGRCLTPWRLIVPASLALATMPRWWPSGYASILALPGLGYFRCPARYTAVGSFGLALLAGAGLDRAIPERRFRLGLAFSVALGVAAIAWAIAWTIGHPSLQRALGGDPGLAMRLGLAAGSWALGLALVLLSRRGNGRQSLLIVAATALEMAAFSQVGGTTRWGWSVHIPRDSPVLTRLDGEAEVRRVGGVLDNLPIRAGFATATPYTGFPLLPPHPLLKAVQDRRNADDPAAARWLARLGVTHLVWDAPLSETIGTVVYRGLDTALDQLAYRAPGLPDHRPWRIVRLGPTFPEARAAIRSLIAADSASLVQALSRRDTPEEAWYLPEDAPPEPRTPRATRARVLSWDGLSGEVEHDGSCDLILIRAHYPGWFVRIDDATERPVGRADGGLIAVRLDGRGVSRVSLRFRPNGLRGSEIASTAGLILALVIAFRPQKERHARNVAVNLR